MPHSFDPAHMFFEPLLAQADVQINGNRPWDIQVHEPALFRRTLREGTIGLGEAYMDGWWDSEALDTFFFHILSADLSKHMRWNMKTTLSLARARFLNPQSRRRSMKVATQHYDLGNEFYQAMLGPTMQYSCGYFDGTDDLVEAERKKMHLIGRKLQVTSADHVLDIGCGWGGLAKYLSETFGCRVTGITISDEQAAFARAQCSGLPIEIRTMDYRDLQGTFDKVVSVGMFEHVGSQNYDTYMDTVQRVLAADGLFLLHSIGTDVPVVPDPWMTTYIFPNSELPDPVGITQSISKRFHIEDWHNFGAHYDTTLMAWYRNFQEAWPRFREQYGDRFERMWRYYLLSCAGSFRARKIELWQLVLSPRGVIGGYPSIR